MFTGAHARARLALGPAGVGLWWAWDARLVTTAVLFFLYLGYLALRRIPAATRRARPSAARSPRSSRSSTCRSCTSRSTWWRTLHQKGTVFNPRAGREDPRRRWRSRSGSACSRSRCSTCYLLDRRYRLAALEEGREERELERRSPSASRAAPTVRRRSSGSAAMSSPSYVITGWALTAVVLGALLAVDRAAHDAAERSLPDGEVGDAVASTPRTVAPRADQRTRYIVAVGGCVVAVVAIVVLAVVLAEQRRLLPDRVRGGARPRRRGHVARSGSPARSSPAPMHETTRRRATSSHRRQAHRRGRPPRRPARRCSRTARRSCARGTGRNAATRRSTPTAS